MHFDKLGNQSKIVSFSVSPKRTDKKHKHNYKRMMQKKKSKIHVPVIKQINNNNSTSEQKTEQKQVTV